jgi:hypothetical protein
MATRREANAVYAAGLVPGLFIGYLVGAGIPGGHHQTPTAADD